MEVLLETWKKEPLIKVLEVLESGSRPKGGVSGISEGVPSIGGEHLNYNGKFNFKKVKYIPKSFFDSMSKAKIKKEDVLIVKDGATTGKTSYVGDDFPYKEAAVNEHVFITRHNSKIIGKLLFYFLYSHEGQLQLKKNISGSAQGGINRSILKNIFVKYPSNLKEQQLIVDEIEKQFTRLDNSIKTFKDVKDKIELYRKSFLKSMFEGKEMVKLEEFIEINGRIGWKGLKRSEYTSEGPLFLAVRNINLDGSLNFDKVDHISKFRYDESPNMKLKNKDVIITKDGTIGKIGYVDKLKDETTVNSSLLIVRPREKFLPRFLFFYFKSPFFQQIVYERITGTAVPHLFQKDIKKLDVPLFSINEQKEIIEEIESKFSVIDKLEESVDKALNKAELLRKSIVKPII